MEAINCPRLYRLRDRAEPSCTGRHARWQASPVISTVGRRRSTDAQPPPIPETEGEEAARTIQMMGGPDVVRASGGKGRHEGRARDGGQRTSAGSDPGVV